MDIDNFNTTHQAKIFSYVKCVNYSFRQIISVFIPNKSLNQLTKKNIRIVLVYSRVTRVLKKKNSFVIFQIIVLRTFFNR